jgi:hypothetical protein
VWQDVQGCQAIFKKTFVWQILITMGVDDLMAARNMVMAAMKTTELKRIDYQTFNSLQKVDNSDIENRYNTLLQRVGTTVSFDPDLVKKSRAPF